MHSTNYTFVFIFILTASVAVLLTGIREVTKERADLNEEIFNKRAILSAVEDHLGSGVSVGDLSNDEVVAIFEKQVEQVVLDMEGNSLEGTLAEDVDMARERKKAEEDRMLPLFIFKEGGEQFYILSVRGNGLWDEIWGNVALESDLNTITGVAFDHKAETPGLGAEIKDNPGFPKMFKGKKIFKNNEYVSIRVRKGGARDSSHEVDAITGATVTCRGVTEMLYRGLKYYEPYFNKIRQSNNAQGLLLVD